MQNDEVKYVSSEFQETIEKLITNKNKNYDKIKACITHVCAIMGQNLSEAVIYTNLGNTEQYGHGLHCQFHEALDGDEEPYLQIFYGTVTADR